MYNLDSAQGRRLVVVVLGLITTLGPMAIDLYLPAIPTIAREMGEPLGRIQLTLSTYTVGFALGQIIFGPMSDRFGRLKIMLPGIIGYIITNLLAATASSATELMVIRMLQALSGSAVLVCVPAMVHDMFPKKECARVLSSVLLVMTIAPLIAPIFGGQLLMLFGWESLFLFLSLLGCIAFVLAFSQLSESLAPENRSPMRPAHLGQAYWNIMSNKRAMGYILAHSFFFGGMFAFISGSPFVYIELFNVPAENYGYLFALNVVMLGICNVLNMRLMERFSLSALLLAGCVIACVAGLILFLNVWSGFGGLAGIVIPCMLFVGMLGITGPNSNTLTLKLFPKSAGTANAAAGVIRFGLGGMTAGLAGLLHDGTAVPMAAIIAGCGTLSLVCFLTLGSFSRDDDSEPEENNQNTGNGMEPLKKAA